MGPRTTICSVTSDSEASHPRQEELHRSRSRSTSMPTVSSTCPPRTRPPESLRRSLSPTTLADSPRRKSKRWSRTPRNTRTDDKLRKKVDAKNGLESYVFQMKNTLNEENLKDKFSDEDKKLIEDEAAATLQFLEG